MYWSTLGIESLKNSKSKNLFVLSNMSASEK